MDPSVGGATRGRGARYRTILIWLLVLSAVLTLEVGLLHERITEDIARVTAAGGSPAPAPAGPLPPVPTRPAEPPTDGAVAAVDLRVLQGCDTGSRCLVRVHVRLAPQPVPTRVGWRVRVEDLCTRTTTLGPPQQRTVPAGADRADVVSAVTIPKGPAWALTPVTVAPGTAAGAPVPFPPRALCGGPVR